MNPDVIAVPKDQIKTLKHQIVANKHEDVRVRAIIREQLARELAVKLIDERLIVIDETVSDKNVVLEASITVIEDWQ